jgi:murein L,D-transpeptidase YcbB/YkuD
MTYADYRLRARESPGSRNEDRRGEGRWVANPDLSSSLEAIVFRPYWSVPPKIQREELVPAIAKDHDYLAAHDLEIVDEQGDVVPGRFSAGKLAHLRSGTLRLRQKPGPGNSLGLVKFVFPNSYHVYMHDTAVRSVFWRSRRDLSHGCIASSHPSARATAKS